MLDDPHDASRFEADAPQRLRHIPGGTVLAVTLASAVILGVTLSACAALAQETPCAPRDQIVSQLERKYGETRRGAGLTSGGAVLEVWASADTGTWTVLTTRPDGTSCAVAAGGAWIEGDKPGRPM